MVLSSFAGSVVAVQTIVWGVRRCRCRGCFLVLAGLAVPAFGSCCWDAALVRVVSCFAIVSAWRWLVVSAVAFLLPVGIGTCGSWAMFPFSGLSVVVLLVATGFGHGNSRYSAFVYF